MDRLGLFSFSPGWSPLHGLDVRAKLLAFVGLSIGLLAAGPPGTLAVTGFTLLLYPIGRIPLARTLWDARFFLLLALFVFLSRAVSLGNAPPGATDLSITAWLHLSGAGVARGAFFVVRFLALFLLAHLFVRTTGRGAIVRGLHWYLAPLPAVPAADIAMMCGLALSFVSVILSEAEEVRAAMQLRAGPRGLRARSRIRILGRELIRRTVVRSVEISNALAARGYTGEAPRPRFRRRPFDWLVCTAVLGGAVLAALW